MNGNKFATGQILKKQVEVVKDRISAGWAPKSPEPWSHALLLEPLVLTTNYIGPKNPAA